MDRAKRSGCYLAMLAAAVLLGGCGEKRVDGPTAPTEVISAEIAAPTTEVMIMPEETISLQEPAVSEITASAKETEPTLQTVPAETESASPVLEQLTETEDSDFVLVSDYLPDAVVELRYAGPNNFTGETIYGFREAYLRYGTVRKLEEVCRELAEQGLYLKIWDAFRPEAAQYKLWEICPDARYVANPERGYSAHTRGNTVDVTMVDEEGREVEMPTDFDDFSTAADRDYSDCTEEARKNAVLLETVMEKHGFSSYWGEWWHFSDLTKYEVETVFDPEEFSWWYADCEEFITLRSKADARSEPLNRIAAGEQIMVLGFTGRFAMADHLGQRGYVLYAYIQPVE